MPAATRASANAAQVGLGKQLGSIDNLMSGGAMQSTGNALDVAIHGLGHVPRRPEHGALPRRPTQPQAGYTRAGNFTTNSTGYLVTQDGYYVQGRTAGGADTLLQIPVGATNMAIAQNGDVTYIGADRHACERGHDLARHVLQLGRPRALRRQPLAAERQLGRADQSRTPGAAMGFTTAGATEMSNVDLAQAFTSMI